MRPSHLLNLLVSVIFTSPYWLESFGFLSTLDQVEGDINFDGQPDLSTRQPDLLMASRQNVLLKFFRHSPPWNSIQTRLR